MKNLPSRSQESDHPQSSGMHARQPLAIAVAMGVMLVGILALAGAFFLSRTPQPVASPEFVATSAVDPVSPKVALFDAAAISAASAAVAHPLTEVESAIFADIDTGAANAPATSSKRDYAFASPSLKPSPKPTLVNSNTTESQFELMPVTVASKNDGFRPSLKPGRGAPKSLAAKITTSIDPLDPLTTHPLNLRPIAHVGGAAQRVSFFSSEDIVLAQTPRSAKTILASLEGDIVNLPSTRTYSLKRGETFVDLLARAGVARQDRNFAASAIAKSVNLRALPAGFEIDLTIASPNRTMFQEMMADDDTEQMVLLSLTTDAGDNKKVTLNKNSDGTFAAQSQSATLTRRLQAISGTIRGNLYTSMREKGAPDSVINGLANVFAFDVDFQREIFEGDRFEAIYEVIYNEDGELIDGGQILFGKLSWRGKRREKGYYFYDPDSKIQQSDYFDEGGNSARRLLMKTPIDGARLSSSFGPRKHPILGYRKSHKGVDFAASRGTPIKATGDGVVERADRYGSFGNYVRIRHNNDYKTAYAHLNGFARGMKSGKRVRQGDIIGYVGTTGRSTGPHLHYEVHHKGKAVNPQSLKIATGVTLTGKTLNGFKQLRTKIDALRIPSDDDTARLASTQSGSAAQ